MTHDVQHVPTPDAAFAGRVQRRREQLGYSQRELADLLSERGERMDQSAVTRLERGARAVKFGEAVALAAILGLSLDELVPGSPSGTTSEQWEAGFVAGGEAVLDLWRQADAERHRTFAAAALTVSMRRPDRSPAGLVRAMVDPNLPDDGEQ